MSIIFLFINIFFAVVFYKSCTVAMDEGRVGWAWTYLILSACNGAVAMSYIF